MWRRPFFGGLYLNLGAKVRTEIELLRLTKLRENISPHRNLLYQQKIDAYAYTLCSTLHNRWFILNGLKLTF